jgi:hypothetical protein
MRGHPTGAFDRLPATSSARWFDYIIVGAGSPGMWI